MIYTNYTDRMISRGEIMILTTLIGHWRINHLKHISLDGDVSKGISI